MLVLTRKKDQTIVINENVEITVLDVQGDQVRIVINAPRSVSVHRNEVFLEIQQENKKASEVGNVSFEEIMKNGLK